MSNKEVKYNQYDEEEGESGGAAGKIEFRYHDILSEEPRDDVLTPEETARLLAVHKDIHKERVDKQKTTRKERKAAKEGPTQLVTRKAYTGSMGSGGVYSKYKTHPIAFKFPGRDQVPVPSENKVDTNKDLQQELMNRLENKLENKLRLQNAPKFNPKPRPFG